MLSKGVLNDQQSGHGPWAPVRRPGLGGMFRYGARAWVMENHDVRDLGVRPLQRCVSSLCPLWVPVSFLSLAFSYLENGENGAHCLPSTELMRRWRGLLSLCPSLFRSFPALSCSALSPRKLTSADCNSCILLRLASLWAQLGAPGE